MEAIDWPEASLPETFYKPPNAKVISFISDTFESILREIQVRPYGRPSITLRRIVSLKPRLTGSSNRLQWDVEDREVTYSWPGKNGEDAWRFACLGRILFEILFAVQKGITITKRDIYYGDPELFKSQRTVDRYVDDIAYTCQVTRADLNVTASPKGLFAGLPNASGDDTAEFNVIPDLIPESFLVLLENIRWILVLEKEAIFKILVGKQFCKSCYDGQGLIVTGKGYPDLATRRFLRICLDTIKRSGNSVTLLGLFDFDPDGINILLTYRFGSAALAQEQAYCTPEMIGLEMDILINDDTSMIPLTRRDRSKARSMLEDCECRKDLSVPGINGHRAILQHMLLLNRKHEIQVLKEQPEDLERWLKKMIMQQHLK